MTWINEFPARIAALDAAHQRRMTREVVPMGGANLLVDGRPMLAFCSNDYLGLASHPMLVRAATEGARQFGIGSGGSPLVSGHSEANGNLQRQLAEFVQLPRTLYFYAGYAANIGIVPALVGAGDALFSDSLNHACLIDGARLSRAKIHRYPHGDLQALEAALASGDAKRKLIISDAVFSMDGDIADVPALLQLCERFDALLLLDDAHGFGVLGEQGRGTLSHFGLSGLRASPRVLYMATLGKAAGVCGAFVAGSDPLIEWLLQTTRSYIFATAAPPLLACALSASIGLIEVGNELRSHLQQRIEQLRTGLAEILPGTGWSLGESSTAIQPLVVGSNEAALSVMDGLTRRGIWVPAIRPPTVPEGTARLRIAMSAAHTEADVDNLINALGEVAHHLTPEIGVFP
ncbi:MAG: 8-amino-7-oxononanoate synthase [Acidovorax sp.]|nr:8-amino-7-oxononanoate synthase [Acidovorax sp.]